MPERILILNEEMRNALLSLIDDSVDYLEDKKMIPVLMQLRAQIDIKVK